MFCLKRKKTYLIFSVLFTSCASRGPEYAAREELFDKLMEPVVVQKVAKVQKQEAPKVELSSLSVEDEEWLKEGHSTKNVEVVEAVPLTSKKISRDLSSNTKVEMRRAPKFKKQKTYSKVVVDDLDLNIVPATSSSSGKGFLLSD